MTTRQVVRALGAILPAALLLLSASPVAAQTTTGTVRGYVTGQDGRALSGVELVVRNLETGVQRAATTKTDGGYVVPGLPPGPYEVTVRQIGRAPDTRRVQVQIGATLLADFALAERTVQLAELQVVAAPVAETRTSEVATNVTQEQINNLPSSDRNFLDLAALAPGAVLLGNRSNDTRKTVAFGAQGPDQINVFIDGASYKNDILKGGVAGQDASRGNPFPRNAVREFRVITQNYKAEYQKASSGIITATTRSGSNLWEGQAFFSHVSRGLVALDTFQIRDKFVADSIANANGTPSTFRKPDYSRALVGGSVGGPLIRDRMHLFLSYEGNYQDRTNRVSITPPTPTPPALDTVSWASRNGDFGSPFRQTMVFGKLSYAVNDRSSLELSLNVREEHDVRDFGGFTSFESATRFNNNVSTGVLKYNLFRNAWLNEATVSYQRYHYNPAPNSPGTVNRFYGFGCCAQIGSNISEQDFRQGRLSLRNDLTWSGFEGAGTHVFKGGVYVDFLDYDIVKRNSETPRFVYEPWHHNFEIPEHVEFQLGDPNFGTSNTQIGAYLQDDWSPTPRLTLNVGIRWDYESGMLNYDYVTPRAVVDSLTKYRSLLVGYPLDTDRYFTDGDDRPQFLGAIQPRIGLSYQLGRSGRTTVFGGWGLFYDRTLFDQAIEERFALQHPSYRILFRRPGDTDANRIDWSNSYLASPEAARQLATSGGQGIPEVKLLPNDLRPPRSQQFSAGVRQQVGDLAVSAAYTGVRSRNVFTFYWANLNFVCPERSFGVAGCFQENRVPGYSSILLADNAGKTWYDALQVQVDRPYRPAAEGLGWGGGLAYTFAKRQTEGFNDDFSFPNPVDYPKQARNDERHRVVANWIMDVPWAWGIQFSGLFMFGTGTKYDVGDRFGGTTNPLRPGAFDPANFRNLDLRLRKAFPALGRSQLGLTMDLFNAFNSQNLGCYNTFSSTDQNFGRAGCVIADARRFQIGGDVRF